MDGMEVAMLDYETNRTVIDEFNAKVNAAQELFVPNKAEHLNTL